MANKPYKTAEKKVVVQPIVEPKPRADYKGDLQKVYDMMKSGIHVEKIMKFIKSVIE